jgi:hypothetical protein
MDDIMIDENKLERMWDSILEIEREYSNKNISTRNIVNRLRKSIEEEYDKCY